ncbi:MAG TPA: hypothetical protein VIB62_08465 [Actinomycetota bacterium]|jgi:hypothetical protein
MGIYQSSGRVANPFGTIGVMVGVIGAAFSVILWIHHYSPDTTLLGSYSAQISSGSQLADGLSVLAAIFGVMAVFSGIIGGFGGKGSASTVASLLLGVVALSYPVLTALNLVERFAPNPLG